MSHAEQPEDINIRLNTIDEQLEQLAHEIDLIRTIQNANRREVRATSQTTARLQRSITRLEEIPRLHQQGLRIAQQEAERGLVVVRQTLAIGKKILINPHPTQDVALLFDAKKRWCWPVMLPAPAPPVRTPRETQPNLSFFIKKNLPKAYQLKGDSVTGT